jgi:hypothetical protein
MILGLTAVIAVIAATSANAAARLLGQHDAWAAYSNGSGAGKTCFVISQPVSMRPKNVNRDPVYFMITHWPREKLYHQISIITGYPYKPESVTTARIGPDSFNFYTKGDGAWIEHHSTEIRMVRAMKKGKDMVVTGRSRRGTKTVDTYSLKGITAALKQLQDECK